MSRTEIVVETDESNLPKLAVGQPATIIVPAYQNRPFQATLTRIGPQVNTQRGVVELRLTPVRLPSYVRPDMTVDVNIEVARIPRALALPASAVVQPEESPHVFVVEGGRARRRNVRVRALSTDWAAVEGISPDAQVILKGTEMSPGQRVRIVEER
jgi:HlyD family secretion protein